MVLSHQTIGGMKWSEPDSDVIPGSIGGTSNATTADRLIGLLANHPRLAGRNIQTVTSVKLSGLKDRKEIRANGGTQPLDQLLERINCADDKSRNGEAWFTYALLRGIFDKAERLGVREALCHHIRA